MRVNAWEISGAAMDASTGVVTLSADALATESQDALVVFASTIAGQTTRVHTYHVIGTVAFPPGGRTAWRGPAAHSVRITCSEALIGLTAGDTTSLSFRNLVFDRCGLALEGAVEDGVLIQECEFIGVVDDFAIRGDSTGKEGPDYVTVTRCGFRECGVAPGHVLPSESPIAQVALEWGTGSVWMPSESRGWRFNGCMFTGGKGVFLRITGSRAAVVDCDFEASSAGPEFLVPFVELAGAESVTLSRVRFGNEPLAPYTSMAIRAPRALGVVRRREASPPVENVCLHAILGGGKPPDPAALVPSTQVTVSVAAPVRGLRLSDIELAPLADVAVRFSDVALTRGSGLLSGMAPQNMARRLGSAIRSRASRWFVGPESSSSRGRSPASGAVERRYGGQFDVPDAWALNALFRTEDPTRESINWLRSSEVRPPPKAPLGPGWLIGGDEAESIAWASVSPWRHVQALAMLSSSPLEFVQLGVTMPDESSLDGIVDSMPVHCLSIWAFLSLTTSVELIVEEDGMEVGRDEYAGHARAYRYWLPFERYRSGSPLTVRVRFKSPSGLGVAGWMAWPQLEPGWSPSAYRRSPEARASGWVHAESWNIGPITIQEGCPARPRAAGDRYVARLSSPGPEWALESYEDARGVLWRGGVAAPSGPGGELQWHLSARENEAGF